jgi:hypothetical protein
MSKAQISLMFLISLLLILSIFTLFLIKIKDLNKINYEFEQKNNYKIEKIKFTLNSFNIKKINYVSQPYILEQDVDYENHYK